MSIDWVAAVEPASVSSRCSAFIDQLNDLCYTDRDTKPYSSSHLPIGMLLEEQNKGQGLGFTIFSVKVERRSLMRIAIGLAGAASSGITWLATLREDLIVEEEDAIMCGMTGAEMEDQR